MKITVNTLMPILAEIKAGRIPEAHRLMDDFFKQAGFESETPAFKIALAFLIGFRASEKVQR